MTVDFIRGCDKSTYLGGPVNRNTNVGKNIFKFIGYDISNLLIIFCAKL